MITIYTAIYGGFDILKKQPKQDIDCRFVCITDNPNIEQEEGAEREIIVDNTYKHRNKRLQARYRKTHPFEKFDGSVIRMDGGGRLTNKHSISHFLSLLKGDILTHKHATRSCMFDEADYCITHNVVKSAGLPLAEQAIYYLDQGFPRWYGLSATSLLVFNKSDKLMRFLDMWFYEMCKRTYQDQMSFEYCIWKYNIDRDRLPYNQFDLTYINFLNNHLVVG